MIDLFVAIIYLMLIGYTAYKFPSTSICLVINSFFLNAALDTNGISFILISVGSLLVFSSVIFLRYFKYKDLFGLPLGVDGFLGALLAVGLVFTSIFGDDFSSSMFIILRFLFLCLSYSILIKIVLEMTGGGYRDIFLSYAFVGLLISIYAVLRGDSSSEYFIRLAIGNESSIPLSLVVAQSMLIFFFFSIKESIVSRRVVFGILFLFLFYVLLLTNTRSTILASMISVVFLLWKTRSYKMFIYVSTGLLIFGLVFLSINDLSSFEQFERIISGFERLSGGGLGESESDRILAWSTASNLFYENPILGVGTGNFGQYYIVYPHNIFMELLSENGLVGLLILLVYVTTGLYFCFKSNSYGVLAASLFVFSLVVAQVSLTLWMHKAMFFWLGLLTYQYSRFKRL